jgi:NADH dehydrogenase [ubiquinone] 1 alpha subcomplex assembly factor 1
MSHKLDDKLLLFDFSKSSTMAEWSSINDVVMGGLSEGGIIWKKNRCMVFSGSISFENNGGFSSIRTRRADYNLTNYKGILISAMGDGKQYKFTIRTDLNYDGVSYQFQFLSVSQEIKDFYLPFEEFKPSYHGKKLSDYPPLDLSAIKRFGFIIADKQEGSFSLEIEKIYAVR